MGGVRMWRQERYEPLRVTERLGETAMWTVSVSLAADLTLPKVAKPTAEKVRRLVSAGTAHSPQLPAARSSSRTTAAVVVDLVQGELPLGATGTPRSGEAVEVPGGPRCQRGPPSTARRKRPLAGRPGSRTARRRPRRRPREAVAVAEGSA